MAELRPVVLCVADSGAATARRVAAVLEAEMHARSGRVVGADAEFESPAEHIRTLFAAGIPIIGVCAAGIVIRAVAPLVSDKSAEPPVLAVAEDGSAVVPLLGGHRGANALARAIAAALEATAAITTAGDLAHGLALDSPPPGWRLANPEDAKPAMAALLAGARLHCDGPLPPALRARASPTLPPAAKAGAGAEAVTLSATTEPVAGGAARLVYHPQVFALGVGCARDCPGAALGDLAERALEDAGIAPGAVAVVASIEIKADEAAILRLAETLGVPARFFDAARLEREAPRLANPSARVFAEVGCHGVAEGAALAAAGPEAALAVEKRKSAEATVAIARAPAPITTLPGRARGRVSLVGIGPGRGDWRTPEATRLIAEADMLVGYGLYIDLIGALAAGKPRADFPLGAEEARCRHALEQAGEGRDIALICSGDAGIYAMGALVWELIDRGDGRGGVSAAARRVEIATAPGISALQAAAARAGALLGHDFCAISLSDLMTPRPTILARIRAAAEGDFVIAFYNPVSRRRRTLLGEARDILLAHRPAATPVLLASNLGREGERLVHRRLAELSVDEVDMLTLVLIGASTSRRIARPEGPVIYTPRGYSNQRVSS